MQRPRRVARRLLTPDLVDQLVGRDDLVGVHEEKRQQNPTLLATQIQLPVAVPDLERPENPEIHYPATVPPLLGADGRFLRQDSRKTDG